MIMATTRGPKSRAGFSPACVRGATRQITEETVRPIQSGAESLEGRPTLQPSVRAKIRKTSRNVPNPSAKHASQNGTVAVG